MNATDGTDDLIRVALDPHRSVVIEACAGSGKTWLLASRILRLLLAGAAPGEILAITFTRKAAREIEERLTGWLRELMLGSDEEVRAFLRQRAVSDDGMDEAMVRSRSLYEAVLTAQPPLTVSTFHGWYVRLLQGAPLTSELTGFTLHESARQIKEEVWQRFAADCGRHNDARAASLLWLLENIGLTATRAMLFGFAERRAEWQAWTGAGEDAVARALGTLRVCLGLAETPGAVQHFFADALLVEALQEYAGLLRRNDTATDRQAADALDAARALADPERAFEAIAAVLLTSEGALRQRKPSQAMDKRLGTQAAARLIGLHALLGERVMATRDARCEERIYLLHTHAFAVGAAWLAALDEHKRAHRWMDFADLEWQVGQLLRDDVRAAFLQARLDARYRHILLDEFQDTNPLQWQILLSWLAAYDASGHGRPDVFIVGDPKQSIYRFRRAEPRVFDCAAAFLRERHAACLLSNDATRRNAPSLIKVINQVFDGDAQFAHFRRHKSLKPALPGRIELLPLCEGSIAQPVDEGGVPQRLRDPLTEPFESVEDQRRRAEAALLVERIGEMVGRWAVVDKESGRERPARFGDIMVLTRRRAILPEFERALRAAGIPYLGAQRGGLLGTLEARDLTALLRCLVTHGDNLALAHGLRTPVLGATDEDLLQLAEREEPDWWQRLQAGAAQGRLGVRLQRAARLLENWDGAARRLPVHDLLDRIYHEGDLVERYRAAVPAALWPGVAANLDAYVELALRLDAGRYPSLPRFLDELARLDETAAEDAPEEGTIHAEEAGDRVRILTIHGAKGLEAPIVWLIDAHNSHQPAQAWSLLIDWPPQKPHPAHFSLLGRKDEWGRRRATFIEAEAAQAAREELNLLYVALTRAQQYLFVSGIADKHGSSTPSFWQRIGNALETLGGEDGTYGEARMCAKKDASPRSASGVDAPVRPCVPVGRRREAASAGMMYGTQLHAALDWLSAGGDAAHSPPGIPAEAWPGLRMSAQALLAAPGLQTWFDPRCHVRAFNELEFSLPDGRVGRIDRLVETEQDWWVLDYKSGQTDAQRLEDYREQLQWYRSAVTALFPGKPVRSALVFSDGTFQEI